MTICRILIFVLLSSGLSNLAARAADAPTRNVLRYAESDYGRALDAREGGIVIDAKMSQKQLPLTLEARVKIMRRNFFFYYVVASAGNSEGAPVWELSMQEKKGLVFSMGQWSTEHEFDLPDDKWHDITVHVGPKSITLYVDGEQIGAEPLPIDMTFQDTTKLWIGQSIDGARTCEGLIDDVRISSGRKPVRNTWSRDDDTVVYLDFEEAASEYLAKWTPIPSTRAETEDWELESDADWLDERFQRMNKGPFFANSTELSDRRIGPKNVSVDLGDGAQIMFDSQRCVTVTGLTQARLVVHPQRFGILRRPSMEGSEQFYIDANRAWQRFDAATNSLTVLNREQVRYGGLYLHDRDVVFAYRVGNSQLLERNTGEAVDQVGYVFRRDFSIKSNGKRLDLALGVTEIPDGDWVENPDEIHVRNGSRVRAVRLAAGGEARLIRKGNRVFVSLPGTDSNVSLFIWNGESSGLSRFRRHCASRQPEELSEFTRGSVGRWGQPLAVKSDVARSDSAPYVVDDIGVPLENPHQALMFASGFDFFSNGTTAALCTVHGDVWLVRGLDDRLEDVSWQRFATGLYQPLGLKIIDDVPHVLGRDQITKLHDLNQDGEADYYANFNNDLVITGQSHAYAMCLETDPEGNFYFLKSGGTPPHGSRLLKVARDGSRLEVFASGYRHPNGLGVGPDGTVTAADNQGNWIPTSAIQIVEPGSFHGYEPERLRPARPGTFDPPLCWIPHFVDNSSGGQVWCNHDGWGPFQGQLLHLSWGRCTLHLVMRQRVGEIWQGGTVQFPNITFASGPARARFNPHDGNLYACGLDGWQTGAERDGCFQRVRFTKKPVLMPKAIDAHRNGLRIAFTQPIDKGEAAKLSNYEVTQWQYRWTEEYGSSEFSVSDPHRIAHDPVQIEKVSVARDGSEVFLHMPAIQPVMQMGVVIRVESTAGVEHKFSIYNTIHALAEEFDTFATQ